MKGIEATIALVALLFAHGFAIADDRTGPTQPEACQLVQERVSALTHIPRTGPAELGWKCEVSALDADWYLVALRSGRKCADWSECSNLMGWYAVNRSNRKVHLFDMGQYKPGEEYTHDP
jgi:hypothetical protein